MRDSTSPLPLAWLEPGCLAPPPPSTTSHSQCRSPSRRTEHRTVGGSALLPKRGIPQRETRQDTTRQLEEPQRNDRASAASTPGRTRSPRDVCRAVVVRHRPSPPLGIRTGSAARTPPAQKEKRTDPARCEQSNGDVPDHENEHRASVIGSAFGSLQDARRRSRTLRRKIGSPGSVLGPRRLAVSRKARRDRRGDVRSVTSDANLRSHDQHDLPELRRILRCPPGRRRAEGRSSTAAPTGRSVPMSCLRAPRRSAARAAGPLGPRSWRIASRSQRTVVGFVPRFRRAALDPGERWNSRRAIRGATDARSSPLDGRWVHR